MAWKESDDDKQIAFYVKALEEMGFDAPLEGEGAKKEDARQKLARIPGYAWQNWQTLTADQVDGNLANLNQLEGQINGDHGLRLAISTLCRQLTARRDSVSHETGSAADVVSYLEEHSIQELDVATAGEDLVRFEDDEPAAGPTR